MAKLSTVARTGPQMKKKRLLTDRSGDLREELEAEMARALQEQIDAEIMRDMLKESGWHEVVLRWIMTHEVSHEVDDWVNRNIKDGYWNRGLVWLFKSDTEAMWFKLRWMSE